MRSFKRSAMMRLGAIALAASSLFSVALESSQADGRRFRFTIWDIHSKGIWRKEVRTRVVARWFRHYTWAVDQRLWLNRRAEGVWITGRALSTFTCRSHCVIRNPIAGGVGFWRIWRTFQRVDVRRFRFHKRIWWAPHLNPKLKETAPPPPDPGGPVSFGLTMDHVEFVTPMEPADPTPTDGVNESVMFMDENGLTHFLGDGFLRQLGFVNPLTGQEQLPDTAMNPGGFQLATTALSENQLPAVQQRLTDDEADMAGMVQWGPGVFVDWLMDDNGNVLKTDAAGVPLDPLDPQVLGDRPNEGEVPKPTGVAGNLLPINFAIPPKLACWLLDPNGEVLGKEPGGPPVIGPPVDENGDGLADPNTPIGGAIPMDLTQFDENNLFNPMPPAVFEIEEEAEPTDADLADLNARLAAQIPNFTPLRKPFSLCIRRFHLRSRWGVDRRVVMDIWRHHLQWVVAHHFTITAVPRRIWLSRLALTSFRSRHHHRVVGQPPVWHTFDLTHLRFFRICYRIHCPLLNVPRLRIDQLMAVIPMDPVDPTQGFMLLTTETDVRNLPPPAILIGLKPDDQFPFDANGIFMQDITEADAGDIQGGSPETFNADLLPAIQAPGLMVDIPLTGNSDDAQLLMDNQLRLHCFMLDANGNLTQEVFDGGGAPGLREIVTFTPGPTQAMPEFFDEDTGVTVANPTMLGATFMAEDLCPWDTDNDGRIGPTDLLGLLAAFGNPFGPTDLLSLLSFFGAPSCP